MVPAPSDYHLFLALQNFLSDKNLGSREDYENRCLEFFTKKDEYFIGRGAYIKQIETEIRSTSNYIYSCSGSSNAQPARSCGRKGRDGKIRERERREKGEREGGEGKRERRERERRERRGEKNGERRRKEKKKSRRERGARVVWRKGLSPEIGVERR
ncbi:hypothetical protein TNCV_1760141 [Trichonephila clavipes]|nr:hypothetical protein TNCV_1760141 [Trichonephila clavipes]